MLTFRSLNDLDGTEGTVSLIDAEHRFKDKANTDIVLVPQPSDDPNDPLNWPKWKKALAFMSLCCFAGLTNWVIAGIGSGILLIMENYQIDLNTAVTGTISWCILTLGLGNFFWVPTGTYFGRRPVYVFASFFFFGALIWSAVTHNFQSQVAARVLQAFMGSSTEGLAASVVADLFFLHERGWWMGVYILFLANGSAFGTIVSGFTITDLGWRWHFWLTAIFAGVNALTILFFFPETQYFRGKDNRVQPIPEASKENAVITSQETDSTSSAQASESSVKPKKSFFQEFKVWSPLNPYVSYISLFIRPWPLVIYPAVIYSFLTFSGVLGWAVCILNVGASIFQVPPYNMTPGIQSLINIPAIIGVGIGTYCGGALTDKFAEWMSRRNNGIYEPENRLVMMILPLFICPAGVLMFGYGVYNQSAWPLPFIGYGLLNFGVGSIPTITLSYLVDCYYPVTSDAMLLSVGLKNVFAFGFSYAIVPWISAQGYKDAFGTMAGVQFGVVLLGLPLWYWGKQIRHASANWKVISW